MKKKLLKFFIIIGALAVLLILISTTQVQAVLQSNPNTHYAKNEKMDDWYKNFRLMETKEGALGLDEKINSNTLMFTTSSNNLDSHLIRSTEYGAIAILSVSGYGNSKTLEKSTIKTTTGNVTGIYFSGQDYEFVAAARTNPNYINRKIL